MTNQVSCARKSQKYHIQSESALNIRVLLLLVNCGISQVHQHFVSLHGIRFTIVLRSSSQDQVFQNSGTLNMDIVGVTGIGMKLLNPSNFRIWKSSMEFYVLGEDLWDVVGWSYTTYRRKVALMTRRSSTGSEGLQKRNFH